MTDRPDQATDFDGCNPGCFNAGQHTLLWGDCQQAVPPARTPDRTELAVEDLASADNPTQLRWGLNDVLWGDDDTVTMLLSGPDREAYWLELDPERAAALREDLVGPDAQQADRQAESTEGTCALCDVVKSDRYALRDHVLNVHPDQFCGTYHQQPCQRDRRERIADVTVPLLLDTLPKAIARARGYEVADAVLAALPAGSGDTAAELDRLRTENARMRHEFEVMYGGAFDSQKPEPATRAAVLREGADTVEAMNEGCGQRKPCASCDARTDAADALRDIASRLAAETQDAKPWLTDSARIGRTLIWSWSDVGKGAFREGYRAAQAEARALLGGERGTDQQPPAVVAEPGKENEAL